MNQQEFVPQGEGDQEEINARSYYRSKKPKSGEVPKSEHPSTFSESIPPYSYHAQDSASFKARGENVVDAEPMRSQQTWRGGNGLGTGTGDRTSTRDYQRQAPSWVRPQRSRSGLGKWIVLIGLALILLKALPLLFIVGGTIIAAVALVVLLPILIIIGIILALVVLAALALTMLGVPIRRWRPDRGWRRRAGPYRRW